VQNPQHLHCPILGNLIEKEVAGGPAFLPDVEDTSFGRKVVASVAEKRILGEVLAGFEHQGAVFDELAATEPSNGEAQCAADVCFLRSP